MDSLKLAVLFLPLLGPPAAHSAPCKPGEKVLMHCLGTDFKKPRELALCASVDLGKTRGALYIRSWLVGKAPDFEFPSEPVHPSEVFELRWGKGSSAVNGGRRHLVFVKDDTVYALGVYNKCVFEQTGCRPVPTTLDMTAQGAGNAEFISCQDVTNFPSQKRLTAYGIPAVNDD